jgi:hypothetical protein
MPPPKEPDEDKLVAPAQVWATLSRPQSDRARAVLIQIAEEMIRNQVSEDAQSDTREGSADEQASSGQRP